MNNPDLIKTFKAGAEIAKYRIVKFDSDDDTVIQGAAATDALIGVAIQQGEAGDPAAASGERLDVALSGVTEVEYGGSVTRGDLLTSDANGKAVAAAPATGANNRVIGVAMVSGVSGDIGSVRIAPGEFQGA